MIKSYHLFEITPIIHPPSHYIFYTTISNFTQRHPQSNTQHLSNIEQAYLLQKRNSSILTQTRPPVTLRNYLSHLLLFYFYSFFLILPSVLRTCIHFQFSHDMIKNSLRLLQLTFNLTHFNICYTSPTQYLRTCKLPSSTVSQKKDVPTYVQSYEHLSYLSFN